MVLDAHLACPCLLRPLVSRPLLAVWTPAGLDEVSLAELAVHSAVPGCLLWEEACSPGQPRASGEASVSAWRAG